MSVDLDAMIKWIAYESAHTVRLAAHITGKTPRYIATEVSRVLSKAQATQRRYTTR